MAHTLPSFENDEVALLISAVEKSLERLYKANERVGGNDAELIEYGRRYSVILQKLQAVLRSQPAN
jgi:hypothetical protein